MMRTTPCLSPLDLAAVPDLAALAALLAVLDVVDRSLVTGHPELADHERPYWIPTHPATLCAAGLLRSIDGLRHAVERYCVALAPPTAAHEPAADGDIPF
jgi:hypothetical protein